MVVTGTHESSRALEEIAPAVFLVRETANGIAAAKENPDQSLGEKWEDLKGGVSHWEEEYPGVVLAIGKVSHALAVLGL